MAQGSKPDYRNYVNLTILSRINTPFKGPTRFMHTLFFYIKKHDISVFNIQKIITNYHFDGSAQNYANPLLAKNAFMRNYDGIFFSA